MAPQCFAEEIVVRWISETDSEDEAKGSKNHELHIPKVRRPRRLREDVTYASSSSSGARFTTRPRPASHLRLNFPKQIVCHTRECATEQEFKTISNGQHARHAIEHLQRGKSTDIASNTKVNTSNSLHRCIVSQGVPEYRGRYGTELVRINSRIVLAKLLALHSREEPYNLYPLTFCRPFRLFIRYHAQMKIELQRLEDEIEAKRSGPESSGEIVEEARRVVEEEIAHVRFYIHFIEERVLESHRRPEDPHPPTTVHFDDLCHLFKTGDLVYVPSVKGAPPKGTYMENASSRHDTDQHIWRVLRAPIRSKHDSSRRSRVYDDVHDLDGNATMRCYYIDYDGVNYRPVDKLFEFPGVLNEIGVPFKDLPVLPIRFVEGWPDILKEAKILGKRFNDVLHHHPRHGFYNGWTLTRTPVGERLITEGDVMPAKQEHIESNVVVDFSKAFTCNPSWKLYRGSRRTEIPELQEEPMPDLPIREVSDADRSNSTQKWRDWITYDDGVTTLEMHDLLRKDPFLSRTPGGSSAPTQFENEDDFALLPRRMFAYSISDRKFVAIDVRFLQRSESRDDMKEPLSQLKIPPTQKELILSLVGAHLDRKRDEDARSFSISGQDLIQGKGKGVVILLHGPPGVGKTATAEAVAEYFHRPLFPITCGDLGTTAKDVEKSLKDILCLARLWNCIMLLDEADIFISQRDRFDFNRNALVSGKHSLAHGRSRPAD